MAKGYD